MLGFYIVDRPLGGRNGGTVLGYTYGTLAAVGILYLMYYGIRKRSYHAKYTTLKGALAAHVWLGIALSIIVPLHSAFQFGLNVHTLAYVLMMVVIISGIIGAVYYVGLAPEIPSHRGAGTIKKHLEQIKIIESDLESLIASKSDQFVDLKGKIDVTYKPSFWSLVLSSPPKLTDKSEIAELLHNLSEGESEEALKMISLVDKKVELIQQMQREVKIMAKLKIWLYIHLPVSFALLAALLIHIFTVFYYR